MTTGTEYLLVWEFRVRAECERAFCTAYGPRGDWAQLFAQADGYLGTELLRDPQTVGRYLTIDRWTHADAFARFRSVYSVEYAALDARCEPWTQAETALGTWQRVDDAEQQHDGGDAPSSKPAR